MHACVEKAGKDVATLVSRMLLLQIVRHSRVHAGQNVSEALI